MTKKIQRELERLRLPELQERYRALLGEETRCPNRAYLIRRIADALEARAARATTSAATPTPRRRRDDARVETAPRADALATPKAVRSVAEPAAKAPRGRFQSMTTEELQTAYLAIVGRSTGSTDRRYLIWKIREAEKGRVPIGPRESRTPGREAATDSRIVPLRLDAPSVAAIDAAWRAQGLKSRMEFFRRALAHYLAHVGAHGAAALFGGA
jgi:hypothetical protein